MMIGQLLVGAMRGTRIVAARCSSSSSTLIKILSHLRVDIKVNHIHVFRVTKAIFSNYSPTS